ncbi:MAG: hypothetical protein NZ849_09900 [Meiothermus sp.]|uniref:hypothetical protein n=1 Tax=Meiothermus sp. TaxID=1955249 RepID=UPI0025EFECD4|nr:hypothetical protein [Meiothermus sp.]MCS7057558.1 hypothetical protein [Meiothermus sp.]MCS7195204.1 hypothetical protein [Meiothermus sp.]MCX7741637.1 hypothetical protein [Meiothermus sp.]MDW8091138.1 hypothetical protein [Meiothermus sp.]MDW8482381.1 hypothetical protein [Meiothermus sp.]
MFGLFRKPDEHLKREGDSAFRVRVRTARHKEVVELRLSKSGEISPSDEGGFYVRKVIVSPQYLDRAVLEIWFDRAYRPVRKAVEGGELVPIREWG